MKNKKLINLIHALCFLALFSIVLIKTSDLLELKTSHECYSEFWENPTDYDVWFMGTSHMLYAVSPMELWNDYGIKSYNIASPSSRMPQIYWTFMCALEYSEPEVIVLDTYHVEKDYLYQESMERLHTGMDAIPPSITKAKAILDIFSKDHEKLTEYMQNFYIYHSRWEELGETDFETIQSPRKGSRMNDKIYDNTAYEIIDQNDMVTDTNVIGYQYLTKIIEECKKRDIELVLCSLPMYKNQDSQRGMNGVQPVADKYGLPFLNILYQDNPVNARFDYSDDEHMNPSGCSKMTKYLGDYLTQNYNLKDLRNDAKTAERWNADYSEYETYIIQEMKQQQKLNRYLLWLRNENFNCYIYTNDRVKETQTKLTQNLFANISNKNEIDYNFAKELLKYDFDADYAFIIMSENNDRVIDTALFTDGVLSMVEVK